MDKETAKPDLNEAALTIDKSMLPLQASSHNSTIDKLIEQNQGLMEQNQGLMEQNRDLQIIIGGLKDQFEKRETDWEKRETDWEKRETDWEKRETDWKQDQSESKNKIDRLEKKIDDLASLLTKSMGIDPKSEKGSSLIGGDNSKEGSGDDNGNGNSNSPTSKDTRHLHERRYLVLIAGSRLSRPESMNSNEELQHWLQRLGSDENLIPSKQKIFGSPLFTVKYDEVSFSFSERERKELFGFSRGLHSKFEISTVHNLNLQVNKTTCRREILTDLQTGMRATKDKSLSLKNTQISWNSLSKISSLIAEYAFPMERLSTAIGLAYFSSSNISRWFLKSADLLILPYIEMGRMLGDLSYVKTDDTSALVLELRQESKTNLIADKQMTGEEWDSYVKNRSEELKTKNGVDLVTIVAQAFGRVSQKANEDGAKKSVNITLISGRLDSYDYKSTVYFYRTHFGQAGNLLSRLIENRSSSSAAMILIQGDLSSQNHLEKDVLAYVKVIYAGCASHARRPFYRHRQKDKQLCFFALRCFALLAKSESMIKHGPMTAVRILRFRKKYSLKIWVLLKGACEAVIAEEKHHLADNLLWKKGDKLYEACAYIVRHYSALTYYLDHPEVDSDNNSSELGLRGEKLIEGASHFRKSENGRVALDIHRTMIASCNASDLSYERYLQFVGNADESDLAENPASYLPHTVAQFLNKHDPPEENLEKSEPLH